MNLIVFPEFRERQMTLQIENLIKNYDNGPVLEGVSLELKEGKTLLLTGGNGSGKTTLLHVAAGLRAADSGTVRVCEERVEKFGNSRHATRLLPQEFSFHPRSTPLDHIQFYRRTEDRTPRVESPLREVSLYEKRNEPVQSLSGGMIQRLGLALTFLHEVPIFLLDEPTNNLDPDWRAYLIEKVKAAEKNGSSLVISSQTPGLWKDLCDRHLHMKEGTLREPEGSLTYSRTAQKQANNGGNEPCGER